MSLEQTPIKPSVRKRALSSPEFLSELKKQCSKISTVSVSPDSPIRLEMMSDMETAVAPENSINTGAGCNIVFGNGDIETIAKVLESTFEAKLTTMVKLIVDGIVSGLQQKLDGLQAENCSLRKENTLLREQIADFQLSQDAAEQYSRRNNIRISGIPETAGESTDDIVIKISKSIDAGVTLDMIDRSHRVGKPAPGKTRDIIVKMTSYRNRQKLMKQLKLLRDSGHRKVFLNEDLTKARGKIYFTARGLLKSGKIAGAWTSDGTVLIKDKSNVVHHVTKESDLVRFTTA